MELYRSPGETGDDGIGAQQQSPRVVVSRTLFSFLGGENKHESRHFKKLGREAKLNVRRCYMKNAVGPSVSSAAPWSLHGDACLRLRIWIGLRISIPYRVERVGWREEEVHIVPLIPEEGRNAADLSRWPPRGYKDGRGWLSHTLSSPLLVRSPAS